MEAPKTPELDKMYAAREGLGTEDIGAFLDWASDEGMTLCESRDSEVMPWLPVRQSINDLLMRYAGIDPGKVEQERRALLDYQRHLNSLSMKQCLTKPEAP